MSGTNFVDYVKICCRSGAGGAGAVHFHRDKHTAKGGPDGALILVSVVLLVGAGMLAVPHLRRAVAATKHTNRP